MKLACYAVKGAEIMDPNVGGEAKLCKLVMSEDQLIAEYVHHGQYRIELRRRWKKY